MKTNCDDFVRLWAEIGDWNCKERGVGRKFRFVTRKLKMDWEERKNKLLYEREGISCSSVLKPTLCLNCSIFCFVTWSIILLANCVAVILQFHNQFTLSQIAITSVSNPRVFPPCLKSVPKLKRMPRVLLGLLCRSVLPLI